jgi:hypothetical protein
LESENEDVGSLDYFDLSGDLNGSSGNDLSDEGSTNNQLFRIEKKIL